MTVFLTGPVTDKHQLLLRGEMPASPLQARVAAVDRNYWRAGAIGRGAVVRPGAVPAQC